MNTGDPSYNREEGAGADDVEEDDPAQLFEALFGSGDSSLPFSNQPRRTSHGTATSTARAAANNNAGLPVTGTAASNLTDFAAMLKLDELPPLQPETSTRLDQLWRQRVASLQCGHEPETADDVDVFEPPPESTLEVLKHNNLNFDVLRPKPEWNYVTPARNALPVEVAALPPAPIAPSDYILAIAIYHPKNGSKLQEYLLLASQPLTALKDRVRCLADLELDGPEYTAGFFFIENVFFDDTRGPQPVKLSDAIRAWIDENQRYTDPNLGLYQSVSMEGVRFKDLHLRVGYPYLYGHQGDCHHVVVVRDMRLLHPSDPQDARQYPYQCFQNRPRKRKCGICDIFPAKFITFNDPLVADNPSFFCEKCYGPLHNDIEDKPLYDVRTEPYHFEP